MSEYQSYAISDEILEQCRLKANAFTGQDRLQCVETSRARLVGYLGEHIFQVEFPEAKYVGDSGDYATDFVLYTTPIDVKSSLLKQPNPLPRYRVSVEGSRLKESFKGIYVFVFIAEDYTKGWIVGARSASEYYSRSILERKGDPTWDGLGTIANDRYIARLSDLRDVKDLRDHALRVSAVVAS